MKERTRQVVVWIMIAGFVGLVSFGVFAALNRVKPGELVEADRGAFVDETVSGQHRLRHPTLGFAFKHPGQNFAVAPTIVEAMKKAEPDNRYHFYAWMDTPPSAAIEVALAPDIVDSRERMAKELEEFEQSFGTAQAVNKIDDGVTWNDQHHDAHFHGEMNGLHFRVRMIAFTPKGKPSILAALIITSQDPTALEDVLASFGPT